MVRDPKHFDRWFWHTVVHSRTLRSIWNIKLTRAVQRAISRNKQLARTVPESIVHATSNDTVNYVQKELLVRSPRMGSIKMGTFVFRHFAKCSRKICSKLTLACSSRRSRYPWNAHGNTLIDVREILLETNVKCWKALSHNGKALFRDEKHSGKTIFCDIQNCIPSALER